MKVNKKERDMWTELENLVCDEFRLLMEVGMKDKTRSSFFANYELSYLSWPVLIVVESQVVI